MSLSKLLSNVETVREMQALRKGWICNKSSKYWGKIIIERDENDVNHVPENLKNAIKPVLDGLCKQGDLIVNVSYNMNSVEVSVYQDYYKQEICRKIEMEVAGVIVRNKSLKQAKIYFVMPKVLIMGDADSSTRKFIKENGLKPDIVTSIVENRLIGDFKRVTVNISEENREKLLDNDGFVNWDGVEYEMFDDLGMSYCESCYSFNHSVVDCRSLIRCLVCCGSHGGVCPLNTSTGKRCCVTCPKPLSFDHHTFSLKCPSVQNQARKLAKEFNIKYKWIVVPVLPSLY